MTAPSRSIFGPLLVIGLGVVLLANNLLDDYSLWTPLLDHWPWVLVVWGGIHIAQHLLARSNGTSGPPRLGAGAVVVALLLCLAGSTGRWIRSNDGIVFRGLGVRVQLRDPAFRTPLPPAPAPADAPHESP